MSNGLQIEVDDDDDDPVRRDVASADVAKAYPFLPVNDRDWSRHQEAARLRDEYMVALDTAAYNRIKGRFPDLKPRRLKPLTLTERLRIPLEWAFVRSQRPSTTPERRAPDKSDQPPGDSSCAPT